jgi:hypothetical protein
LTAAQAAFTALHSVLPEPYSAVTSFRPPDSPLWFRPAVFDVMPCSA